MAFQSGRMRRVKGDKYEEELEVKFYSCKVYFICTAIHHFIDKKGKRTAAGCTLAFFLFGNGCKATVAAADHRF